jgi:hypothetical protein
VLVCLDAACALLLGGGGASHCFGRVMSTFISEAASCNYTHLAFAVLRCWICYLFALRFLVLMSNVDLAVSTYMSELNWLAPYTAS